MADAIPIDEYQRWYGPRQAINHLKPVATSTVIDALRAGIRSGAIKAAAHLIIETFPGEPPTQVGSYERLSPGTWIDQAEQRFWDFGSITIEPPTVPGRGMMETFSARGHGPDQELTGVRLDPTAIDNLLAQLRPTLDYSGVNDVVRAAAAQVAKSVSSAPPPITPIHPYGRANLTARAAPILDHLGPHAATTLLSEGAAPESTAALAAPSAVDDVSETEVQVWYAALPDADQKRGFLWLWREVRAAHAPRRVYKKHVLPFVKDRRIGRPPKAR